MSSATATKSKKKEDETRQLSVGGVDNLAELLADTLKIQAPQASLLPPPAPLFEKEIARTPFTIFEPLHDIGSFGWCPRGGYKNLTQIQSTQEVTKHINMHHEASELIDIRTIALPQRFHQNLTSRSYENKFPYGRTMGAALHVAVKLCKLNLEDEIDFCFGGSVLGMLATHNSSGDPFFATKIPGTKVIVIIKCKDYAMNLADLGFQFERLVTGQNMRNSKTPPDTVEHVQMMRVGGKYTVLFQAEVDAVYKGAPVELTAGNPRYFGSKKLLQMVSNGSPHMCHGVKQRGVLEEIRLRTLSECAGDIHHHKELERNILTAMAEIQQQIVDDDKVCQVSFVGGKVRLGPPQVPQGLAVVLPPPEIVRELIAGMGSEAAVAST